MMPHFGNVGQMFGLEMYYVSLTIHFLLSLAMVSNLRTSGWLGFSYSLSKASLLTGSRL